MKIILFISILLSSIIQFNTQTNSSDSDKIYQKSFQQRVTFRIQIAASEYPLSAKKLKLICPNYGIINNEKHDGWYKYTVGEFNNYKKAATEKKKLGIKGSFIVAYVDGKRLNNINKVVPKNNYIQ